MARGSQQTGFTQPLREKYAPLSIIWLPLAPSLTCVSDDGHRGAHEHVRALPSLLGDAPPAHSGIRLPVGLHVPRQGGPRHRAVGGSVNVDHSKVVLGSYQVIHTYIM